MHAGTVFLGVLPVSKGYLIGLHGLNIRSMYRIIDRTVMKTIMKTNDETRPYTTYRLIYVL